MTVTNVSTTCAVVIFRVKVSCITSVDGMKLVDLIGQLSHYVIGRLSVKPCCYLLVNLGKDQSIFFAVITLLIRIQSKLS